VGDFREPGGDKRGDRPLLPAEDQQGRRQKFEGLDRPEKEHEWAEETWLGGSSFELIQFAE